MPDAVWHFLNSAVWQKVYTYLAQLKESAGQRPAKSGPHIVHLGGQNESAPLHVHVYIAKTGGATMYVFLALVCLETVYSLLVNRLLLYCHGLIPVALW